MPPPAPPVALKDHCSVIENDTLYVYSPAAFQSLPLRSDAQWSQEPMGISVTGATCVQGGIDGDNSRPALYVVGGSTNSSSIQYPGLQRYDFQDKRWDTVTPIVPVTQNRQSHGATYLNSSSSIVVYAGSQNGDSNPSTQTFLMSTVPPYGVQAYQSQGAPPAVRPLMMAWNNDLAVMMGGGPSNNQLYTFGPQEGWQNVGVTLTGGLPDSSVAQCGLLSLGDGSKVLETFDMSQSPNSVTRTVILNPGGIPAAPGQSVGKRTSEEPPAKRQRRDLTLNDLPKYNGTLAPKATRNGFSLAQGADNRIVISGGSTEDPLCIFNQDDNSWLNATQFLQGKASQVSIGGGNNSPASSATPAPSSSPTTSSSDNGGSSKSHVLTILGAVLGAIFGLAALCIIALLLLRFLKKRKGEARRRRSLDFPVDHKDPDSQFGMDDRDTSPLSLAPQPMGRGPVPLSASAAVFSGQTQGQQKSISPVPNNASVRPAATNSNAGYGQRAPDNESGFYTGPTTNSTRLAQRKPGDDTTFGQGTGANPIVASSIPVRTRSPLVSPQPEETRPNTGAADASSGEIDPSLHGTNRRTDEGWAKYFQGSNTIADGRSTYASQASESDYRGSYWRDVDNQTGERRKSPGPGRLRDSQGNILTRMNIAMGSPSIEHPSSDGRGTGLVVHQGQSGKISNGSADSSSSMSEEDAKKRHESEVDYDGIGDAYSSGIPASINDGQAWEPVGNTWSGPAQRPRAPSSSYTTSVYPPTAAGGDRDTQISSFPLPGGNNRPLTRWPDEDGNLPPTSQPATARHVGPPPVRPPRPSAQIRDYFGPNPGQERMNSDMSWLNLGNNR